ncbi:MAG: hypothetical protein JXA30_21835 [Deltaproteobacteria bacterium]|nr:hypothetical protein [Deltaproteobacteria bacterium]
MKNKTTRPTRAPNRTCLISAMIGWLCSCAVAGTDDAPPLNVSITHQGKAIDEVFLVVAADEADEVESIYCPSKRSLSHNLVCADSGFRIERPARRFELTVKVPGYRHVSRIIDTADLASDEAEKTLEIALVELEPFEYEQHYCTGFELADGLERFERMAVVTQGEFGPAQAIKFYISDLATQPRVYFQNTVSYPLHYDFARRVLKLPLSLSQFEADTYYGEARPAMAGTLIRYPSLEAESKTKKDKIRAPVTLTFFPSDNLTPTQALQAYQLIEERTLFLSLSGGQDRLVYLPAGATQEEQAAGASGGFARRGALWMAHSGLFGNLSLQILNPGLAYGTLRRLSPDEIETTVLSFTDIVILTRLPNDLPIVGGTITEELQTPLAHVNIAARNRGTPNIALLDAGQRPEIAGLLGKLVRFEVKDGDYTLVESDIETAQAFWRDRRPDPVAPDFDLSNIGLLGFEELGFEDSIRVGVKAANLAELSQLLKEQAPRGFAVPFYYYDRFIRLASLSRPLCEEAQSDCVKEGRQAEICQSAFELCLIGGETSETLWDYVDRLLDDPRFISDSALREAALDSLRYAIGHSEVDPAFASQLDARVAEVFGDDKVRLRSSTNAEDLPDFSGAGLYDSVSAYAAGEMAASSRIRKVWASVWNFKAFEERSFWNVDQRSIRMGVAVNQAFTEEAANGVLITRNIADPYVAGMYVNVQKGELSVTNPEAGSTPEIFAIVPAPSSGIQLVHFAYSSLSADKPLLEHKEAESLYRAALLVEERFTRLYADNLRDPVFDLEFKFHGPERALFIKQVRPYHSGW